MIRIGFEAFKECAIEGELIIPRTVKSVGDFCFARCDSLTSVLFEPSSVLVRFGRWIFSDCSQMDRVVLPQNVSPERSPMKAANFRCCTSLTAITIPETCLLIESGCFEGCSSLTSMDIPESVCSIDHRETFKNCTALEQITIRSSSLQFSHMPNQVAEGDGVFHGCTALATIRMFPWHWPALFGSMQADPSFIFQFLREYRYQMEGYIDWKKTDD